MIGTLDILAKARKGTIRPGHKYTSRTRDPKSGAWVYEYAANTTAAPRQAEQPIATAQSAGVQFYATIDSDSIRAYMPAMASLFPVSSWVRKAKFGPDGMVAGKIPPIRLPAHMRDPKVEKGADGGGFVAARVWGGEYKFTLGQYTDWLDTWKPTWAAMLDFCCEPAIAASPAAVRERQDKTTANAKTAWAKHKDAPWAWVPTVQGWTLDDYRRHARELKPMIALMTQHYTDRAIEAGADAPPRSPAGFRVGIGTLCCRTSRNQIAAIVRAVAEELPGVPLHLWGVKLDLFKMSDALPDQVVSSDSAAWSGRFGTDLEAYKQSGLTQREHAYTVALPDYTGRIQAAQGKPKQRVLDLPSALYDWAKLAPPDEPPPVFDCPYCDTTCDYEDTWDAMDEQEQGDVRRFLEKGLCPTCMAPLPPKKQKKRRMEMSMKTVSSFMSHARRRPAALRKSLGWHKYRSRKRGHGGGWVYTYDDPPAPPRRPAPDVDLLDGATRGEVESLVLRRGLRHEDRYHDDDTKALAQMDEEDKAEAHGYTYRYISLARQVSGAAARAAGIEDAAFVGGKIIMTKHPLGINELHALELRPVDEHERAEAVIDYYHKLHGDGPIVLMASPPERDETEDADQWQEVKQRYARRKRGVIIHHNTKGPGYQASYFDVEGFSHDTTGHDLAELVSRVMKENYGKPTSPAAFDKQAGAEEFGDSERKQRDFPAFVKKKQEEEQKRIAEARKSNRGRMMGAVDLLRKARKGDQAAGHKYKSRHKGKDGEWVYVYDEPAAQQHDMFAEGHRAGAHGELPKPAGLTPKAVKPPKAEPERYKHGYVDYSDKEINQIAELVEHVATGHTAAIDRRKYTEPVLRFALTRGLLSTEQWKGGGATREPWKYGPIKGKVYPGDVPGGFLEHDLPPEVLWRLFDKHILKGRQKAGKSLASAEGWLNLNIHPAGHRFDTPTEATERERIILKLASHGYFLFQSSGEIWNLEVDKRTRERYGITAKSRATVGDVLSKARKGDMAAGHKYQARTYDAAAGHFVYHYRKGPGKHLTAAHIFEALNRNKNADLREVQRQIRLGKGEAAPEFAEHFDQAQQAAYGMAHALDTGRLPGVVHSYVEKARGKELAEIVAAVLPHVETQGDVPAVMIKLWGSSEKQSELAELLRYRAMSKFDQERMQVPKMLQKPKTKGSAK